MGFAMKIAKTLRNHWKKSVFFALSSAYGVKYSKDKYNAETLRREYCKEARKYGLQSVSLNQRPRRLTVFLNPAAHNGKGLKLFEKNAAPIFHLAGLEVNIVKTEYEGQVKDFLSVLEKDDIDGIVVAGGDGTLLETITGIMRKNNKAFNQTVPIGIIPLGKTNRFAKLLFHHNREHIRLIMDAAMAVVKSATKQYDVIEIKSEDEKTVYALSGMTLGVYHDAEERKSKYWYFGPLKSYWTYLRTAMKSWPPAVKLKMDYVQVTEEDLAMKEKPTMLDKQRVTLPNSWSLFSFLYKPRLVTAQDEQDYEKEIIGSDSVDWVSMEVSTVELTMMSSNFRPPDQMFQALEIGLGPEAPTKTEVIREGWRRISEKTLKFGTDLNKKLEVKKLKLKPKLKEGEVLWYSLDGEEFEAKPVEITLLKNRINVFCNGSSTTSDR